MRIGRIAIALGILVATGCGGGIEIPDDAIATVDGTHLLLSDLDSYLALHLLPDDDAEPGDQAASDRVKSRLLDALIDERILRLEAERRKLVATDADVEAYLHTEMEDVQAEEERPGATGSEEGAWRRYATRRLLILELEEAVAAALPEIEEGEVQEYLERHGADWKPEHRVGLRALRVDSVEAAKKAYEEIRRRRMTFDEAVVTHGLTLEQAAPVEVALSRLADEVRQAIEGLRAGQVSRPVETAGGTYLFRVEVWSEPPDDDAGHLAERARRELDRHRRRWAAESLLEELRQRARVTIHRQRLPFVYVSDGDR